MKVWLSLADARPQDVSPFPNRLRRFLKSALRAWGLHARKFHQRPRAERKRNHVESASNYDPRYRGRGSRRSRQHRRQVPRKQTAFGAIREKTNNALDALIEAMEAADVQEILIDEGAKKLILTSEAKIKIKARKKDKSTGEWTESDEE